MSSAFSEAVDVLHIIGSPKGDASTSSRIAGAFLDAYQGSHPDNQLTVLDVWNTALPPFDGELAIAKLAPILGEDRTAEQTAAWARVEEVVREFDRFDKVVISTPMWNFSLPYRLKHYIDLLVQPGLTFGLDSKLQHVGLLKDRPVQLILTRSSPLPVGSPEDFQLPYLKHILAFIGIRDVRALIVEGTTLPQSARGELVAKYCDQARVAAEDF